MLEWLSSACSTMTCFVAGALVWSVASVGPNKPVDGFRGSASTRVADPIGEIVRQTDRAARTSQTRAPVIPARRVSTAVVELPSWFAQKPVDGPRMISHDRGGVGRFAIVPMAVPAPRLALRPKPKSLWPMWQQKAAAITKLVALRSAPFPYDGNVPSQEHAFLDVEEDGRRGHGASHGRVLWEDETFNDPRSLLHIPAGFDVNRPSVLVLFFHGHGATLTRDVWRRQQLPEQVSASEMNAVLVAPQFAVDAADSSSGKFWAKDGLRRYLRDVSGALAALYGQPTARRAFARMPVIVVAYSGGFAPAALAIRSKALAGRLRGVVLLDAMYGYRQTFENWADDLKDGFFINVYGRSTARRSRFLETQLGEQNVAIANALPARLGHGEVVSIEADVPHRDYVSSSFAAYPVAEILRRVNFVASLHPNNRVAGAWR